MNRKIISAFDHEINNSTFKFSYLFQPDALFKYFYELFSLFYSNLIDASILYYL